MLSPAQVAAGYALISKVNPPLVTGLHEFLDLPLLRSVDPRQLDHLDHLVKVTPYAAWEQVRIAVAGQRAIREALHHHVLELDARLRDAPDTFVFPDPYSLLLWIWTFQLFGELYTRPPRGVWKKYFYRGEAKDYGTTRFQPKIARPGVARAARSPDVPARARALLRGHAFPEATSQQLSVSLDRYLVDTMSCAQALAVAQHYGFPTPLLDITAHPEVAVWFATLSKSTDVGVLGCWELDVNSLDVYRSLAIVTVPPIFSRVRLQSGYFICSRAATATPAIPPQVLFFRHCPDLEPVQPTWLMLIGPVRDSGDDRTDILEDLLQLEDLFKREWPDVVPGSFPPPPAMSLTEIEGVVRLAAADLMTSAGRQGIMEDGRRFIEIHHPLLYSINRHAPHHIYQYAVALHSVLAGGNRAVAPLAQGLVNLFRALVAGAIGEDRHLKPIEALEMTRGLTVEQVMRIAAAVVGKFDDHAMPWPLNSWYQGGDTAV